MSDDKRRVIKMLPVKLKTAEWEERARAACRLTDEIADQERKIDSEKEAAKARVKDAEAILEGMFARQRLLSRVVREGTEDREVACHVTLDRAAMQKTVVRVDTGETVDTCPISTTEARDGAEWKPNYIAKCGELIHPDEPGTVLDTRPLQEREKQLPLTGDGPKLVETISPETTSEPLKQPLVKMAKGKKSKAEKADGDEGSEE